MTNENAQPPQNPGNAGPTENWNGSAGLGGGTAQPFPERGNEAAYYTGEEGDDSENGTDSDTVSSDGYANYDDLIPEGTPQSQVAAQLFWQYTRAKAAWRRVTGKPVRKLRRFIRRKFGKGKGKGKGKSSSFNATAYLTAMTDDDVEEVFFKGKGKGKSLSLIHI